MPDSKVINDDWSDLSRILPVPDIDFQRLHRYRLNRIKAELRRADAAMCVLVNPISLRYAVDYRGYALFQAHIPTTYLFVPVDGPVVIHGPYGDADGADEIRKNRAICFFDAGPDLPEAARLLADDIVNFLSEIGTDNRRVAVEYVNPSITQAMMQRGLDVMDGVDISEPARVIKSDDEVACIRWAVAVAQHGIAKMKEAMRPGISELQLWALLNYTNLANDGDWHDGRMLASGPRINPWLQGASMRKIESGDLVGFDTDMIGPFGYFADISRTFHCGPAAPTKRQREVYQLAVREVEHNIALIRPGVRFEDFRAKAFLQESEFHKNAYSCLIHGVGMCDEYPQIRAVFQENVPFGGVFERNMVICVESYVGAVGEDDGVKLEQQVLVTDEGTTLLSTYPYEETLMQ